MKKETETDEKVKVKQILKKAFIQPQFLKILLWALFGFITTVVFRGDYEGPIATNIEDCAMLVFVVFCVLQIVVRLVYVLLQWKGNKSQSDEKLMCNWSIANVIQFLVLFATIIVLGVGYCNITAYCWVSAAFIILSFDDVIKNIVGKDNKKRFLATIIVSVSVVACVFGTTQWANAEYDKNRSSMLDYNGVPVSITDFIETKSEYKDKVLSVKSTKLGQQYAFSSNYEIDEDSRYYFNYEIFTSDYEQATKSYVSFLRKKYKKYDNELVKADRTFGWDELYYEVIDGEVSQRGYAVKDNMVIMLDYIDLPEEIGFFEKAYEKLN